MSCTALPRSSTAGSLEAIFCLIVFKECGGGGAPVLKDSETLEVVASGELPLSSDAEDDWGLVVVGIAAI